MPLALMDIPRQSVCEAAVRRFRDDPVYAYCTQRATQEQRAAQDPQPYFPRKPIGTAWLSGIDDFALQVLVLHWFLSFSVSGLVDYRFAAYTAHEPPLLFQNFFTFVVIRSSPPRCSLTLCSLCDLLLNPVFCLLFPNS